MNWVVRNLLIFFLVIHTVWNVNTQAGCLKNWTEYRNVCCFMNSTGKMRWNDARYDCMKKGGDIARITDQDVNEFILRTYRKFSREHLWIGLTRCSFNTTKWCYPDGVEALYSNWDKTNKEPNNQRGIEDCTEMYHEGTWNDYPCTLSRPYVCQMPYDVDECQLKTPKCSPAAKCTNTIGSYTCTCNEGFKGNGTICEDIDECAIKIDNCHNHAGCTNTKGSFNCMCKSGYSGNGTICEDIDECVINMHNCHSHAVCKNTKGSFNCLCKSRYSGNGTFCDESRSPFGKLNNQVKELYNSGMSFEARKKAAQNIVDELSYLTDQDVIGGGKNERHNITETVKILQNIVNLNISDSSLNILGPASNILNNRNTETWRNMKDKGVIRDLVTTLENYGFQCGNNLENKTYNSSVFQNHSNVQLHVKYFKSNGKLAQRERVINFSNVSFSLSPDALATESNAVIVILWYKTLNSFFGKNLSTNNVNATVNSKVISASVRPEPRMPFREPVRIVWDTADTIESEECVYWKPELGENRWKTDGCTKVPDEHRLVCECKHLTAFASMDISRNVITDEERQTLEIISTVGCSASLLGVALTILTYALLWKRLHKNAKTSIPSQVLMNLCVAIGMTDIFAVLAGPAYDNEPFCIAVSMSLYFFVLSLFGWMLCEGIVIYLQLVNVFKGLGLGGKHLKAFYVIGWGVPAIIMAVLVGVNDLENFKSKHACWCQGGGGLFWTFVGTIVLILLINIIIFTLALRSAMSSSMACTSGNDDSTLKKAKVGLKGSAILLPILGLTWLFGLMVFNRDTIAFKYLFAIFNSLQGLMIFVFHVLVNRKIRSSIKKEKKALTTTHTTYAFSKNNLYDGVSKSETSSTPVFLKKIVANSPFAVKKRYNLEHSSNETLKPNEDEFRYTKGSSEEEFDGQP